MSVFKSQWIVTKIKKIDEKGYLYLVFFRDYWFLWVSKRKKAKEKSLDLGYNFNCEIHTSSSKNIHTISNMRIRNFYISENKWYKEIEAFLWFLNFLTKEIPEGNPHEEIFESLEIYLSSSHQSFESFLLLRIKAKEILWNLEIWHSDETTRKILKFISNKSYKEIIKLRNIPEESKKFLEKLL